MKSMTGYSYAEYNDGNITVSVEIKSYNSRFLDLTVNVPSFLNKLEVFFREKISSSVVRGKVDVYIRIREEQPKTEIVVNTEAVIAYSKAISSIANVLQKSVSEIPLELIIKQEGVLTSKRDYDMDSYRNLIEPVFNQALNDFILDRQREGENLKEDLLAKLKELDKACTFFSEWQPKMENLFKETITNKFKEILDSSFDEQRVLTEVAAMLVKYTINEEIVRLQSHLKALRYELEENPCPGRKIDFICQEINREINTIGSKNQFTEVGSMVISAKNALENIREQARNVE